MLKKRNNGVYNLNRKLLAVILFLFVIISDQATKLIIDSTFVLHQSVPVFGDFLRLTYIRNPGAAFGFTVGSPQVMLSINIVITIFLMYLIISGKAASERIGKTALVFILGGAIGNLIDRFRLGEVIDFIDMGISSSLRWPVYNFADIYVTMGMILLVISFIKSEFHQKT